MEAHLKNALMTTGIVLAMIFVLRKIPVAGPLVSKALNG